VNVGPGHIISIRNSIVLSKIISLVFGCKLLAFNNFDLLNAKKYKKTKALISLKNQNILLNVKNKNINKIKKEDLAKFKNYKSNLELNIKDIKSLLLKNRFAKKIVPISF
jgi:tRNA A37 threonylcarbamoyladenosine modification protein TsaB